jgi:hypothetical protein
MPGESSTAVVAVNARPAAGRLGGYAGLYGRKTMAAAMAGLTRVANDDNMTFSV